MGHFERISPVYPIKLNYKEILWNTMKKRSSCAQPNWAANSEASLCREYAAMLLICDTFAAVIALHGSSPYKRDRHILLINQQDARTSARRIIRPPILICPSHSVQPAKKSFCLIIFHFSPLVKGQYLVLVILSQCVEIRFEHAVLQGL